MSTEAKTTTCYMCACRCGIRVHLKHGELRYIAGLLAERWYFFAEARHPQNLYYQSIS